MHQGEFFIWGQEHIDWSATAFLLQHWELSSQAGHLAVAEMSPAKCPPE